MYEGREGPRMLRPRTRPEHRRARTLSLDSVACMTFFHSILRFCSAFAMFRKSLGSERDGGEMTAALFTRMTQGYIASHALVLRYHQHHSITTLLDRTPMAGRMRQRACLAEGACRHGLGRPLVAAEAAVRRPDHVSSRRRTGSLHLLVGGTQMEPFSPVYPKG